MRYLLDVNALIALGITRHQFHDRVTTWLSSLAADGIPKLATCSITELGFVRIVSQVSAYNVTLEQAKTQLSRLKEVDRYDITFLPDGNDVSKLPTWVSTSKQTTDGHLVGLATRQKCLLATLDEGIPDAFVIPA